MKLTIVSLILLAVAHTLPTEPMVVSGPNSNQPQQLSVSPDKKANNGTMKNSGQSQNPNPARYEPSGGSGIGSIASEAYDRFSQQASNRIENIFSPANVPWFLKKVVDSQKLQDSITEDALRERAQKLFEIAQTSTKNNGHPTRVIDSKGHWGTVNYILSELAKLSKYYSYTVQNFDAYDGEVKSCSLIIDGVELPSVSAFKLSPPTLNKKPVAGRLVLIPDDGCDLVDYPKTFAKGDIALVKRGACWLTHKSKVAGKAGASGLIIYDEHYPSNGSLSFPSGKEVPTVSIPEKDARKYIDILTKNPEHKFCTTLFVDSYVKKFSTVNVVAETRGGDHNNVVSLGAHSDSVREGPGINDNGSGTLALLEVAKQLTRFKVKNAVRFVWFSAEEQGLIGSYAYASGLSNSENLKTRVFMDYDMIASPNYEYRILDGSNKNLPKGCKELTNLYAKWYQSNNLDYKIVPFDGRSDYTAMLYHGIPVGGINTGADEKKSKESAAKSGGEADKWFDQCYQKACDNLKNVNYKAWVTNTKLIAHGVATYAKSFEGFPQRRSMGANEETHKLIDTFKYRGGNLVI